MKKIVIIGIIVLIAFSSIFSMFDLSKVENGLSFFSFFPSIFGGLVSLFQQVYFLLASQPVIFAIFSVLVVCLIVKLILCEVLK